MHKTQAHEVKCRKPSFKSFLFLVSLLFTFNLFSSAWAANYIVNTNTDNNDGVCNVVHCSLREAINEANNSSASDNISFNIVGATISLSSALPSLSDDGISINGAKNITLDGSSAGSFANGIEIHSSNNRIQGLIITNFNRDGVLIKSVGANLSNNNIIGTNGDGNNDNNEGNTIINNNFSGIRIEGNYTSKNDGHHIISGNFIGVEGDGTTAAANGVAGIAIFNSEHNQIGSDWYDPPNAAKRNIISANGGHGIYLKGESNLVVNNYIGTDITGTVALGNNGDGVAVYFTKYNLIGKNIISANGINGVGLGAAISNTVMDNIIGADITKTQPLGNEYNGIRVFAISGNEAKHNRIGFAGNYMEEFVINGNTIAFNKGNGVYIDSHTEGFKALDNPILYNSIFSNDGYGIELVSSDTADSICTDGPNSNDSGDIDGGGNGSLNYPELTSVVLNTNNITVTADINDGLPSTWFKIQFFSSPDCDSSGFGEGQTYLGETGVSTDINGNATTGAVTLPLVTIGEHITTTAYVINNFGPVTSSEFSQCMQVTSSAKGKFTAKISKTPHVISKKRIKLTPKIKGKFSKKCIIKNNAFKIRIMEDKQQTDNQKRTKR